ncbi:MAG: hypothetical protein ABSF59_20955 [Candidatus Sulfotelmatobacter sp.]|jgi:hypothetical protein
MKTVGVSRTIRESRLSKQILANDDAAARAEEVEEQIEEDNVEKAAGDNRTGAPIPFMSSKQIETADDAAASREEVKEQAEERRIDKAAFEDEIGTAAAEERTRHGHTHD